MVMDWCLMLQVHASIVAGEDKAAQHAYEWMDAFSTRSTSLTKFKSLVLLRTFLSDLAASI